jgi:hypothetical protein
MDPTKVQCVVVPGADSEEDIKRVTFPRNLYPKFYEINDEVRWIEKRMVEVRSK